jgi:hypothetical protein
VPVDDSVLFGIRIGFARSSLWSRRCPECRHALSPGRDSADSLPATTTAWQTPTKAAVTRITQRRDAPRIPEQRRALTFPSARNLMHYVALRRHDIRHLQSQLASLGLSSLGRTEPHVLGALHAVMEILHQLAGSQETWSSPTDCSATKRGHRVSSTKYRSSAWPSPSRT